MAVIHLSKDNFNEEVLESKVPVMVDFWATWCGPCKTMTPIVEEIAEERTDIKVCKIDVDQEPELARQYRVMSIPTFLVFKEGEVGNRDMGVMSKEEVEGLSREGAKTLAESLPQQGGLVGAGGAGGDLGRSRSRRARFCPRSVPRKESGAGGRSRAVGRYHVSEQGEGV